MASSLDQALEQQLRSNNSHEGNTSTAEGHLPRTAATISPHAEAHVSASYKVQCTTYLAQHDALFREIDELKKQVLVTRPKLGSEPSSNTFSGVFFAPGR